MLVKNQFSRWTGAAILAVNGGVQVLTLPTHLTWSLSTIALGLVGVYGLVACGKRCSGAGRATAFSAHPSRRLRFRGPLPGQRSPSASYLPVTSTAAGSMTRCSGGVGTARRKRWTARGASGWQAMANGPPGLASSAVLHEMRRASGIDGRSDMGTNASPGEGADLGGIARCR